MEHRRDGELTDAELAEVEAETRALLARWGEPTMASPPADLSARVVRHLSAAPAHRGWHWRPLWLAAPLVLLVLGFWGLSIDSNGPASLFGDPATGAGRYVLGLTLVAKPLWHLWLAGAGWWLLGLFVLFAAGWLWWRLILDAPLAEVWQ
ncbi:hypothetical protein [uncultured Chloroflexus sp.]|uniref:hypothetical protein n=1 Tax=uncultured Chloroflexus sp. TaxID=214040 RepID=UPI0026363776|nr:hypothetical protein [uncultured Chloroflexus sp.]